MKPVFQQSMKVVGSYEKVTKEWSTCREAIEQKSMFERKGEKYLLFK